MVSRVVYRNVGEIRDIWESLLDTCIYPDCHEDDRETQGMAFLSFTTMSIFKRSREKQKKLEAEVESLQQQLQVKQVEYKILQEKQELAKQKQLSADLNGCRTQDCQNCVKLETEVSNLKSSIKVVFANLSKFAQDSNENASEGDEHQKQAFTYMTQVLNGTQGIIPTAQVTPSKKRPTEPVTPDEIQGTPEVPKKMRLADRLKKKTFRDKLHLKKPLHIPPSLEKSPKDEGTSPIKAKKKNLLSSPVKQSSEDSFLVKNTEDLNETLQIKTILKENRVIESLPTESAHPNQEGSHCSKGGKENKNISDEVGEERLLVNLSTDVPFPSTPERPTQIKKQGSPILGSAGSKKSNAKRTGRISTHENTSPSLLGDSHTTHVSAESSIARQVSQVVLNKARYDILIEKHGNNRKKFIQPTLTNHFQPRTTDLAALVEFNGGKRSDSDLGVGVLKLSEAEQVDYAMKESLKEANLRESSRDLPFFTAPKWELGHNEGGDVHEDDDFVLASPTGTLPNVRKGNRSKVSGSTIERAAFEEAKSINETFFDPHLPSAQEGPSGGKPPVTKGSVETQFNPPFASTMITEDPKQADKKQNSSKTRFIPHSSTAIAETQFNPPFASTMITEDPKQADKKQNSSKTQFIPHSSTAIAETQFNPPIASTPCEVTQNSELEAMVQEINGNTTPDCLLTSYDRLPSKNPPSPNYVYKRDVIRKKNEKLQLPGWDCPDCAPFYKAAGYEPNDPRLKNTLNKCSRHRDKFGMRPSTPKGFWDPGFPSSLIADKTFSSE